MLGRTSTQLSGDQVSHSSAGEDTDRVSRRNGGACEGDQGKQVPVVRNTRKEQAQLVVLDIAW
jgi:hypothetical protein